MSKKSTIHDIRFEAMLKLLREARTEKGLTQEVLSARLGQHRVYVNKVESGQRRIDVAELFDLCRELDISIYSIIQSTFDNNSKQVMEKVMETSPEYTLGFSNGYVLGRGHQQSQSK